MKNIVKLLCAKLAVVAIVAMAAMPALAANPGDAELKNAISHPLVQNNLAVMFAEGRGVPQSYAKAAEWFRKSADQGDAFGQASLAYLYTVGKGVPKDYTQSFRWYKMAAFQGDAWSQYHLGMQYYLGKGVSQSYASAKLWLSRAAAQGNTTAKYYLTKITPPTYVNVPLAQPDQAVQTTADGLGITFLQGAGATLNFEMIWFWIIAPLLAVFAI